MLMETVTYFYYDIEVGYILSFVVEFTVTNEGETTTKVTGRPSGSEYLGIR
jgi:hypothetical protein